MSNWPTKKLGEIAEVGAGNSAPQDKKYFSNGTIPFFRTADVGRVHFSTDLSDMGDFLNKEAVEKLGLKIWPKNTILFPKSGASTFLNHRVMIGTDGVVSSHLATIFTENNTLQRYIFYFLTTIDAKTLTADQGYPSLRISDLQKLKIPLPPVAIQKQIVERLDKIAEAQKLNDDIIQKSDELFQSLLHKELNPAGKNWEMKKLEEVLDYEQPTKYIVSSTDYKDEYPTPVLTAGKSFILGNTNEVEGIFPREKLPVIIFDDFTTAIKFVDFPFKVKSSAMKILHAIKNKADINFLFYTMSTIKFIPAQHKRYWISEYSKIEVPIPSLKTQKQIVAKLSAAQEYKSRLLEQKAKLKELFESALHRSFE